MTLGHMPGERSIGEVSLKTEYKTGFDMKPVANEAAVFVPGFTGLSATQMTPSLRVTPELAFIGPG